MGYAKQFCGIMAALFIFVGFSSISRAESITIGLHGKAGEAQKYQALQQYFAKKGITIAFQAAPDYKSAAEMFSKGSVDAMFSGSGVAGVLIIKGQAEPLVRSVSQEGISTYGTTIVAAKGSPKFAGTADYFNGKRVIFQAFASAGEMYFRSLGKSNPREMMKAASHAAALDALSRGAADVAVIKNHVWNKEKDKYPQLEMVHEDRGQNPDGTLIVSKKMSPTLVQKINGILLGMKDDSSAEAKAVRESLKIREFIKTTDADFRHTVTMLKNAGVTKDFAYQF